MRCCGACLPGEAKFLLLGLVSRLWENRRVGFYWVRTGARRSAVDEGFARAHRSNKSLRKLPDRGFVSCLGVSRDKQETMALLNMLMKRKDESKDSDDTDGSAKRPRYWTDEEHMRFLGAMKVSLKLLRQKEDCGGWGAAPGDC